MLWCSCLGAVFHCSRPKTLILWICLAAPIGADFAPATERGFFYAIKKGAQNCFLILVFLSALTFFLLTDDDYGIF